MKKGRKVTKKIGAKKAAEKARKIIEGNLAMGKGALPEQQKQLPTLEEHYRVFERTYVKTALRTTTQRMYDVGFRLHILPKLGHKRLDSSLKIPSLSQP